MRWSFRRNPRFALCVKQRATRTSFGHNIADDHRIDVALDVISDRSPPPMNVPNEEVGFFGLEGERLRHFSLRRSIVRKHDTLQSILLGGLQTANLRSRRIFHLNNTGNPLQLMYCFEFWFNSFFKSKGSSGVRATHITWEGTLTVTSASTENAVTRVTFTDIDNPESVSSNFRFEYSFDIAISW